MQAKWGERNFRSFLADTPPMTYQALGSIQFHYLNLKVLHESFSNLNRKILNEMQLNEKELRF